LPDNGSESNFWCGQFGRNARPRQRPDADPGPTRRDHWQAAAVMSNDSFAPSEEFPGLAVLTLAVLKGGEPSRFNDDRSKLEHIKLPLASLLFYSFFGIRSRFGELRLALGIMPVPTAETEPTGQAGPSKPAKPLADLLMTQFLGKAVVKPIVASDDGEFVGSMSGRDSTGCFSHDGLDEGLRSQCPAKL
jgi:hypothetical protein